MYTVTELNNCENFDSKVIRDNETGRYRIDYMVNGTKEIIQSVDVPHCHEIVGRIERYHLETMDMISLQAAQAIHDIKAL